MRHSLRAECTSLKLELVAEERKSAGLECMLRQEEAELIRRLRRELQEESCAKRAAQSRLEKAKALIEVKAEQVKEQAELECMLRREQAERDKGSDEMDVKLSEL